MFTKRGFLTRTAQGVGPAALLLLGCLGLAPQRAAAQEPAVQGSAAPRSAVQGPLTWPFYFTNNSENEVIVFCKGPWFRYSGNIIVPPRAQGFHFYTAVDTIFPAHGEWQCEGRVGSGLFRTRFCLGVWPDPLTEPVLTKNVGRAISVNLKAPPCGSTMAAGFLGYAASASASPGGISPPDQQAAYQFDGEAGESVTATLERDSSKGSAGDIAQVILRNAQGDIVEQSTGALPVTITASLPASGSYVVEVIQAAQSGTESSTPFRGYYQLTVSDESGEALQLEPLPSTKP